jgi:hypothetical protein
MSIPFLLLVSQDCSLELLVSSPSKLEMEIPMPKEAYIGFS